MKSSVSYKQTNFDTFGDSCGWLLIGTVSVTSSPALPASRLANSFWGFPDERVTIQIGDEYRQFSNDSAEK